MEEKLAKELDKFEIDKLKTIIDSYQNALKNIGEIELQILTLQKNKEELFNKYKEVLEKEKDLISQLNKKYGEGIINPENWTFTSKN